MLFKKVEMDVSVRSWRILSHNYVPWSIHLIQKNYRDVQNVYNFRANNIELHDMLHSYVYNFDYTSFMSFVDNWQPEPFMTIAAMMILGWLLRTSLSKEDPAMRFLLPICGYEVHFQSTNSGNKLIWNSAWT